jgi:hypothetical protein
MKFLADTAGRGGLRILAFAPGVGCSHMHNKCMKENEVSDASLSWAYGHLLHVHFPCVFLFGAAQIANDQWWITKRIAYIDGSASLAYHRLQPEQHRQTSTGQFTMSVTQLHCALAWISGFKRCKVAQTLWTLPIRCTILMIITISHSCYHSCHHFCYHQYCCHCCCHYHSINSHSLLSGIKQWRSGICC